jgi:hypothetical protein
MTNRPSVVLVELVRLAHLVPADSGNESPDRCKKEVFVTGAHQSTECADEDQHEGNDKGLRAHGLGRLEFWSLALALVQSNQGLSNLEVRSLGDASRQIADGRLTTIANRRDVFLREFAGFEFRDE